MSHTPPTEEERISQILKHYKEYVTGIYQGTADYDEGVAQHALLALLAEAKQCPQTVTRFEVIDHSSTNDIGFDRVLVKYDIQAELSYQDDNRTLKVFLKDREGSIEK